MTKPIETSIEMLLKPSDRADDCPDVTRCQLERVKMSDEEGAALLVEDTGDPLTKNMQVFLKKPGLGCDYQLRVGMVEGLPTEYIYISNKNFDLVECYLLFDIAAGEIIDIDKYESREGSPPKPNLEKALCVSTDPEYDAFCLWRNYNFEVSTNPVYAFNFTTTDDSLTTCIESGYVLDTEYEDYINEIGGAKPYYDHENIKTTCPDDAESYVISKLDANQRDIDAPYYRFGAIATSSEYITRSRYFGYTVDDLVTGESFSINSSMTYGKDSWGDWTYDDNWQRTDSWSVNTKLIVSVSVDGSILTTDTHYEYYVESLDNGFTGGTGSYMWPPSSPTGTYIWDAQATVGEVYACALSGGAVGFKVHEDEDGWEEWVAFHDLGYYSYYTCGGGPTGDWPDPEIKWLPVPSISLLSDLTVYDGDMLSFRNVLEESVQKKNDALRAAMLEYLVQYKIGLDIMHETYPQINVTTLLTRTPVFEMRKARI